MPMNSRKVSECVDLFSHSWLQLLKYSGTFFMYLLLSSVGFMLGQAFFSWNPPASRLQVEERAPFSWSLQSQLWLVPVKTWAIL